VTSDAAQFERDRVRQVLRARLFGAEAAPARLGRFEVRGRIGQGATGVVYRAFDPQLAREVALKLLGGAPGKRLMARLQAEGRALARLSHPNVVAVHDVGEHEGEVFLAMQLVAGADLRSWLASASRSEGEMVDVLLDSARGLSAAHREGLVHRDFKPENVLVGAHGGVVADFGLAALTTPEEAPAGPASALGTTPAGTPAYMAPEQWAGGSVDARADQYAFGLVLLEALARSPAPLGDRQPPSPERISAALASVPPAYRALIVRALAPKPTDRFESMEALGAALARARSARSRGRSVMGAAIGALVVVALLAGAWAASAPPVCPGAAERWNGVWDAERTTRIQAAFGATGLPFSGRAFETTRAALDAYRARWLEAHQAICEATFVRHEQSEALLDRRMACLERARQAVDAAADVLDDADPTTVIRASRVVTDLPAIDACRLAETEDAPRVSGETTEVERHLASARADLSAGRFTEGASEAEAAALGASEASAPALEAEAGVVLGRIHHEAGDYPAAEATLVRAIAVAIAAPAPRAAAAGSVALLETYAVGLSRYADAEHWSDLADAHLGALEDPGAIRADLMLARGELYRNMYRRDDAIAALTEAVDLQRAAYGAESPRVAAAMTRLGMARLDAEGCALIEEARGIRERTLGEGHPDLADSYDRLANCALSSNDPERAGELHARALALRRSVLGPDHRDVARSCFNFAWLRLNQERLEETEELYACARRIYGAAGNRHFEAASLIGLADVRLRQRRLDEAEVLLASAAAIYRETVPREHGSVARLETQLGRLALLRGLGAEARAHYDEARRISLATHEVGVESLSLEGAGRAALALGEGAEARSLFEQGLARAAAEPEPSPSALATFRFRLAEALLVEDPAASAEARAMAAEARAELARSPSAWAATSTLAEIDAWLANPGGAMGIGRSSGTADGYGAGTGR
jgi:tetratricopeptide (TPR) repeat protein